MTTATKATPRATAPKAKAAKTAKQRTCAAGRPTWLPSLSDGCSKPPVRPAAMLCQEHEAMWREAGGRKELTRLRALVAVQRQKARDARTAKELSIESAKAEHVVQTPAGRHATPELAAAAKAKRAAQQSPKATQ